MTRFRHGEPIAPARLGQDFWAFAPDQARVDNTTYLPVVGGCVFPTRFLQSYGVG
jgi:hypothetical protein